MPDFIPASGAGGGAPSHSAASPLNVGACLFALSFSTVLFALAVFKLLSFFIMPSLFFDLLFIGFPIGAFLGARYFAIEPRAFLRSLWLLQAIMAASVAACLLAKNFDYLRAHLFDVQIGQLLLQVGLFAGLFLPFFVAYGLSEYLGYQVGRKLLAGRMRVVYAIYLFGSAAADGFLQVALPALGMTRVLAIAFAGTALAVVAMGQGSSRRAAWIELVALAILAVIPGVEHAFLDLYRGSGPASTRDFETREGYTNVFQKWGRYSLVEVLASPDRTSYLGFYNDFQQWEYSPTFGFRHRILGVIPIMETKPGDRIAIIGAGGGRQVRMAQKLGRRKIVAIELEPAVFEAVRSKEYLLDAFARVYEYPDVTPLAREARGYFESTNERFDLIYLPSVGGYPQMMIEPGNLIRTNQAYRTLRDHLTDTGTLAIWYPKGLDLKGVLTDQYVRTLRGLGMGVTAYQNDHEHLILAHKSKTQPFPTIDAMQATLFPETETWKANDPEWFRENTPHVTEVADDPDFTPIPDERPFLAGNVRHVLTVEQVCELFGIAGGVLLVAGVIIFAALRHRGDPGIPGRSYRQVAGLALLLGANFLVIEHALILALFQRLFVFSDSLVLGAICFLFLSGLGSLITGRRLRPVVTGLGVVAIVVLLAVPGRLSANGVLALMAPVALATGSFFPALFDQSARNPLGVFALDAIGAGLGSIVSTFIPILFGFGPFFVLAGLLFLVTAAANLAFHRGLVTPES
jgi:spermidine synthase